MTPTETKLKPCPFCGGEGAKSEDGQDMTWSIYCLACCVQTYSFDLPKKAISAWNQRHDEK